MGFRPSELSPSTRYRAVSDIDAPACCFSCRCSRVPKHRAGPTGRSFQVLTLAEVPGERDRIRIAIRWMLPWALPFQGSLTETLTEGSRPGLLSRACDRETCGAATWTIPHIATRLRLRVSIGPGLARSFRNECAAARTKQPS
jgi:hypothetical protein